jgi:ankyrin repeat protein
VSLFHFHVNGQTRIIVDAIENRIQQEMDYQLILFADSGNLKQVITLIETGANPNNPSWGGITAIMYAAQAGHYKVVKELISSGANLNAQNDSGLTPLHYAAIQNHDSIAELLILNGANVHPINDLGVSPLHYASSYGYPFIAYLLLHYGAPIDSSDYFGNTPLMVSVCSGVKSTTQYLLENWANVDKPDSKGFTPLMVAAQYNDTALMRILTDYGANIYARNSSDVTALALAINSRAEDAMFFLLERDGNIPELHSETSYAELAYRKGYKDVSRYLQKRGSPLSKSMKINSFVPVYYGFSSNLNDFYFNIGSKANFSNYGFYFGLDIGIRPYRKAVLVDEEYVSYQFFEQRNIVSISLGKDLATKFLKNGAAITLSGGVKTGLSWGYYSYPDAERKPKVYSLLSPELAIRYQKGNIFLAASSYFMFMDHLKESPITTSITVGYTIDKAYPKIFSKRKEWF